MSVCSREYHRKIISHEQACKSFLWITRHQSYTESVNVLTSNAKEAALSL
nr:MAG TPA: hypothetical protein [Caudoviricetes sp.]